MKRDYYEILGVDRGVSPDQLKRAYRTLAHRYHPDKNPEDPDAEARFKEASEAYAVLSDPEKRSVYDRLGHAGISGGGGDPFAGFDPFSNFSDLFNEFFGGDLFGRRQRGGAQRGADLRYDLEVDFSVVANGGESTLRIPRHETCEACEGRGGDRETCPACHGHGSVQLQQGFFRISRTCDRCQGLGESLRRACSECRGHGRVENVQTRTVRIPAGVDHGTRLRLQGEGEAGLRGGPAGDLYVVISAEEHPLFEREGADILCELPVSISQAALGGKVDVPTIEGKTELELRPGTQSGQVIRLRGCGLPRLGGGPRGDQHVRIFVEIPTRLSDEQRELLQRFAEVSGDEVTPRRRGFLATLRDLLE
jgi:molecular chaperone DnaJ